MRLAHSVLLLGPLLVGWAHIRVEGPETPPVRWTDGHQIELRFHPALHGELPVEEVAAAIERAMQTWSAEPLGVRFTRGEDAEVRSPARDDVNGIYFEHEELPPEVDPERVLAFAARVSITCTGVYVESDVVFNAVNQRWSTADEAGQRVADVETITLHELGHVLGLDHTDVDGAVMVPSVQDRIRRVPHDDDLAGLAALYPEEAGGPCDRDADCGDGEVCLFGFQSDRRLAPRCGSPVGAAAPGDACAPDPMNMCATGCASALCLAEARRCSAVCADHGDCPDDMVCVPERADAQTWGRFCGVGVHCEDDPTGCPEGTACTVRTDPVDRDLVRLCGAAGPAPDGAPCRFGGECSGGVCWRFACTRICDGDAHCQGGPCEVEAIPIDNEVSVEVGLCAAPPEPDAGPDAAPLDAAAPDAAAPDAAPPDSGWEDVRTPDAGPPPDAALAAPDAGDDPPPPDGALPDAPAEDAAQPDARAADAAPVTRLEPSADGGCDCRQRPGRSPTWWASLLILVVRRRRP